MGFSLKGLYFTVKLDGVNLIRDAEVDRDGKRATISMKIGQKGEITSWELRNDENEVIYYADDLKVNVREDEILSLEGERHEN